MQTTAVAAYHRPLWLLLALVVFSVPTLGHRKEPLDTLARTGTVTAPYNARLQNLLDAAIWEGLPGVSLRVNGPGIDFKGAAGVADLATGEPLTTNHVMYVASLGKTFTATLALQLCDEGRLDLERPITAWLPSEVTKRIPSSDRITLRHLLSHTSGLIDYMNDDKAWRSDFARDPHRQWTHSDIISYLYGTLLLFEPGSNYHYSNSNYIVVGLIIEQATGQSLPTLIRERLLEPLGLRYTFNGQETVRTAQQAHGYIRNRGRIIDTHPWYDHYGLADSGIHSTPGELALFLKSLFANGELLSEAMRTEMTSVSELGHPPSHYGMGIYVRRNHSGAGRWYTHDGIDPGYQADMMYLPDLDLTVVLSTNASLGSANFIYEKLIAAVVEVALHAVWDNCR